MEETKQRFIASERSMYHNLHKKGLLDSDIANQLFNYCSAISLEQPVAGVHVGAESREEPHAVPERERGEGEDELCEASGEPC